MCEEKTRYSLVVQNLQEVVGDAELRTILQNSDGKVLEVYWGTATTGKPHVAYFVPICKIADMLHAGVKVTVLFADLHAYLDNMKSPWSILCHRATYYETVIKAMLESVGVRLDQLHFVRGSDYELSRAYSEDVYRISADTSVRDARKAGAEVVKQVANPLVSGLLYPLLQALDEEYLHVDAQFGGVDQRKIFVMAERILPRLGYRKRIHLMNPMVPGLTGDKMSASEAASKIDLLESSASVHAKLATAACPPGQRAAEGNGVLAFIKFVIFPLVNLAASGSGVKVGETHFATFEELEDAYVAGVAGVSPETLRACIFDHLDPRIEVVRQRFTEPRFSKLLSDAYPADEAMCAEKHASESAGSSLTATFKDDRLTALKSCLFSTESQLPSLDATSMRSVADILTLRPEALKSLKPRRVLRCMWSIAPAGVPHLGHTLPLRILAQLSRIVGIHVIILIDDIGAFLEGNCPWEARESRCALFERVLRAVFKAFAGDEKALTIVRGHDFKCEGSYMLDLYRLVSLVPEKEAFDCSGATTPSSQRQEQAGDARGEGEEEGSGLNLSALLLPCTALLDAYHLEADLRLSSPRSVEGQEKFAKQFLPRFDTSHSPPLFVPHALLPALITGTATEEAAVMTTFVPPLRDPRMAQSAAAQAVGRVASERCLPLIEPPPPGVPAIASSLILPGLKRRLKQAFCQPGNVHINPLLEIFKAVALPELAPGENLVLPRPEQHGGPITLTPSEYNGASCHLDDLFANEVWHPGDLKAALEAALLQGLQRRLVEYLPPADLSRLIDDAFPVPGKKSKKATPGKSKYTEVKTVDNVKEGEERKNAAKLDEFDPSLLEVRVGEVVDVKPHPISADFNVCRVAFDAGAKDRVSVIGLPAEALMHKKAVFLTNLRPCDIGGVTSEVKVVCVGDKEMLQCPHHTLGSVLRFQAARREGRRAKAATNTTIIDPEAHPGWRAFFADVYYSPDGDGALCWRQNWRLSLAP
ncbi:Tyrosine--tRNA ligase, cytoplasmic [Echinococcus granulosus]|uniref:Tyrosine--tRNA ligase n=1 Tax=Echinococcus granulosus TaxID=6210 RepID=A0A068WT09_ECHGR|nr:Tyrosine--tRNA ligase, cytoplasmic [Echinococcus granulosus]CDS20763.1 tyrosyl tRNA synthetase [Echinococcus granulosus]